MYFTKSFISAYKTAPGLVQFPTHLRAVASNFVHQLRFSERKAAVIFFKTSEYQNSGFIPQHIDLSFLKMFSFSLRSEVLCLTCNNLSCNSTMENVPLLHLDKVCSVWWPTRNALYMISSQQWGLNDCSAHWLTLHYISQCKAGKDNMYL